MQEGPRSNRASFYGFAPGPPSSRGWLNSGEPGISGVPNSPEKGRILGPRRVAVASLIAVWLAFTFPLFAGKVHFPTDFAGPRPVAARGGPPSNPDDGDAYFALYPWHAYLGAQLRAGHLPMWDPSRFGGAPYAANPAMGTFYPLNWLYAAGDTLFVETLIWAATLLASLLLSYWFLRLLTLHPYAAALGAVTWTFSGFMMAWGTSDPVLGAAAWLPLALGGLEVARRGRPRWGIPLAGLGLALSVLAGHAQITLYVWLAVAIWAAVSGVVAAAGARRGGGGAVLRELARAAGPALGAFVIGAGLAAVPILGALELSGQITRQSMTYRLALASRLPPRAWPTVLLPDYLGNPLDGNYAGASPVYTQTTFYAGVLVLPLAVAGLLHRSRRASAFFGLVLLVGVLAAFGTPFYRILFTSVPGLARTAAVARFIFFVDVGLAGLAALGLDAILRPPPCARPRQAASQQGLAGASRAPAWVALGASAGAVALLGGLTAERWGTSLPGAYVTPQGVRALVFASCGLLAILILTRWPSTMVAVGLLVVGLAAADLWLYGFRFHPFQRPRAMYPALDEVRHLSSVPGARPRFAQTDGWQLPFNASMVYGLYGINGYDVFIPVRFADLIALADADERTYALSNFVWPLQGTQTQPPVLDLLGVRSDTAPLPATGPGTRAFSGTFAVFDQTGAFPPSFLATCWQTTSDAAALERLKTMSASQLRSTAIVSDGPGSGAGGGSGPGPSGGNCQAGPAGAIRSYEAERVVVDTPDARPGVLVLTDQWYPGWTVSVDRRPAQMLVVDHALRGVALPAGPHRIEFRYRPRWPLEGLAITILAVDLALLLIASGGRRRAGPVRKSPSEAPRPPRPEPAERTGGGQAPGRTAPAATSSRRDR